MKPVNAETVAAEVARLEEAERAGGLTLKGEFTLAALRKLLAYETTPPVAVLRPVVLPSAFTPAVTSFGPSPVSSMRLDHMGGWLNKARVIAAIREAGYEVNATAPAEGKE